MELGYSRESQKLIYWLFSDYAKFKYAKEGKLSEFEMYTAKEEIKKAYLKVTYKPKFEPLETFQEDLATIVSSLVLLDLDDAVMVDNIVSHTTDLVVVELQKFMLKYGSFSVALKLMTQEGANSFIRFMFDYFHENDIPFRKEILSLIDENCLKSHVYHCIMKRKCCISGELGADLDHWKTAASIGGYKHCDGLKTPFVPLARRYHQEIDIIGRDSFAKKYNILPVTLKEKDVKWLVENSVYPNQFKGYKK